MDPKNVTLKKENGYEWSFFYLIYSFLFEYKMVKSLISKTTDNTNAKEQDLAPRSFSHNQGLLLFWHIWGMLYFSG